MTGVFMSMINVFYIDGKQPMFLLHRCFSPITMILNIVVFFFCVNFDKLMMNWHTEEDIEDVLTEYCFQHNIDFFTRNISVNLWILPNFLKLWIFLIYIDVFHQNTSMFSDRYYRHIDSYRRFQHRLLNMDILL